MILRIWQWLDERWPFTQIIHLTLDEEIPGGSRYAYTLGSAVFITFTLQAVSGIMQLFFYVPTVDHAYDSISYLRTEAPFGWLIHGIHYWGANIMIILLAMHIIRVFIWGAYKKPRELTWLAGITLLLTTMAFSLTGAPLHWDQRGYWAGEVGTSIAGTTPIFGDLAKRILRGGENMGQLTLSRFFVAHTSILPVALIALFGIHIIAMRRFGSVGPWIKEKREQSGSFWPDQAFKDVVVGTSVLFILITLAVFLPSTYSGQADILDTSYIPKPEWNFLFLYQALKYFQGSLEPVGTIGVPTVIMMFLVLLPFIDRNPERNPFKRPIAILCGLIFASVLIALSVIGYYSPGFAVSGFESRKPAVAKAALPKNIENGAGLFRTEGCTGCHRINGTGRTVGPDLSQEALRGRNRQWLTDQIRNPKSHNPNTIMPPFASLTEEQLSDLIDYLMSLGGGSAPSTASPISSPTSTTSQGLSEHHHHMDSSSQTMPGRAASIIGSYDRGKVLFANICSPCHGREGIDNVSNPGSSEGKVPQLNPVDREHFDRNPKTFAENIDRYIQHGSTPAGARPALSMPAFGDTNSLTQQEIANIEAYVMRLNGVDRAEIINPGMQPRHFFWMVIAIYIVVILIQGGIRVRKNIP